MAKKQPTQFIYYINGKGYPLTAGKDGVTEEVITVLRDSYHREYLNNRYERENSDPLFELHKDLYEKKLTTYPRTDARVLSTAVAKEIGKNISRLKGYEPVQGYVERIMKEGLHYNIVKTQYTDDSKITDHYAIIPTGHLPKNLSEPE